MNIHPMQGACPTCGGDMGKSIDQAVASLNKAGILDVSHSGNGTVVLMREGRSLGFGGVCNACIELAIYKHLAQDG